MRPRYRRAIVRAVLIGVVPAIIGALTGRPVAAQNFFWNGANPNASPVTGGAGVWDSSLLDWRSDLTTGAAAAWVSGSTTVANIGDPGTNATFSISLGADITLNKIVFTNNTSRNYTIDTAASTTHFITFSGASPEIDIGAGTQNATDFVSANVVATNQLAIIDKETALGGAPVFNFIGSGDSFTGGILIDSPTKSPLFNFVFNAATNPNSPAAVMRVNFNSNTAAGVGAGAGDITIAANGIRFSNANNVAGLVRNTVNHIILNPNNLPNFVIAMGATNASSGGTQNEILYNGDISGNADILLANDVTWKSGGAGITIFGGTQKTYTGKTIINGSSASLFQIGADNVLPVNNVLQFGAIPVGANVAPSDTGAVDLDGHTLTVAAVTTALTNTVTNTTANINGITNSTASMSTLVINGSTTDAYGGGIGLTKSAIVLGVSNNNVALTRTGTGTTILGTTNAGSSTSTYIGNTLVAGSSSLVAGSTTAFSPNSNFTVSGDNSFGGSGIATLDLNGFNNTINSLSGTASGIVTNNSQFNSAVLAIGGTGSLNATPAPTATFSGILQDGTGGNTLGLTKSGNGTQILAAANTYTGPTTINRGTLRLATTGSIAAASSVMIAANGTLAGTGTAYGQVTVQSSGTVAPGTTTTPGGLNVGSMAVMGGGNYNWKITDAAAAASTGYDTINSPGSLVLDGSLATNPFTITLNSLGLTPANFNPTATDQHWTLATFTDQAGTFDPAEFNVLASGFKGTNLFSSFNVSNPSPGVLQLNYVPGTPPSDLLWVGPSGSGGGTGTWMPSGGTNWNDGSQNTGWASTRAADFTTGTGIVTLGGAISTPLIVFDVDGYTIAGANSLSAASGFSSLTVQVTNAGTTGTINVPIVSPLTLLGSGTLVLGGANTFGGGNITVTSGILRGNVASLGGAGGNTSATAINNNSVVIFDQSTTATYSGTMDGGGMLVKQNTGTLILNGASSYSGGTMLSGGTLRVSNDASLGAAGGLFTFDGGVLNLLGVSTTRPITVTTTAGSMLDDSGDLNVFSGGANLAAGAVLTKTGSGILQVKTAPWNGSGTLVINQGKLLLGDPNDPNSNPSTFMGGNSISLASGANLTIAAFSGAAGSVTPAALALNGDTTISLFKTGGAGGFSPALNSTTTVSGGLITFNASSDLLGIPNGLLQSSTITLGPTTFNGDTTIQTVAGGTGTAATGVAFGAVADNGHTLTFLGQGNATAGYGPGTGVTINGVMNDMTVTATGNWIIGDPAGTNAQILTLNAQHVTHPEFALTTGNVTVNPGSQLNIASLSTTAVYGPESGVQTITLNGQGPVDLAHPGQFLGSLFVASRAQPIFNPNVNLVLATNTLINIDNSNALIATQATFNGPVTGSGGLTLKAGDTDGRLIFNGPNNLTGYTTITGGKLQVNLGSSMGTGDLTMAQAGGQNTDLLLNNTAQSVGNLRSLYAGSATGPVFQEIHVHGTALSITQTANADYGIDPADGATPSGSDSTISGTGSIVLSSASTAELSLSDPNNSYSGTTTINGGSLAISTDSNLGLAPATSTPGQLRVNGGQFHGKGGAPLVLAATRGFAVGPNGGTLRTDAATPLTIPGVTTFSNSAATLTIAANSYVKFNPTANATAIATGSSVTVASGATLELAGGASALSDGAAGNVDVVNNSVATGGGLSVTGTSQNVGFISGSGNTVVAAGSDLTASGIIQNSLVIGGSAGSPASVTIRASDADGAMMAAESGVDNSLLTSIGSAAPLSPPALIGGVPGPSGAVGFGGRITAGLNLAAGAAAVPEPSMLVLVVLGLSGVATARIRRRRRAAN